MSVQIKFKYEGNAVDDEISCTSTIHDLKSRIALLFDLELPTIKLLGLTPGRLPEDSTKLETLPKIKAKLQSSTSAAKPTANAPIVVTVLGSKAEHLKHLAEEDEKLAVIQAIERAEEEERMAREAVIEAERQRREEERRRYEEERQRVLERERRERDRVLEEERRLAALEEGQGSLSLTVDAVLDESCLELSSTSDEGNMVDESEVMIDNDPSYVMVDSDALERHTDNAHRVRLPPDTMQKALEHKASFPLVFKITPAIDTNREQSTMNSSTTTDNNNNRGNSRSSDSGESKGITRLPSVYAVVGECDSAPGMMIASPHLMSQLYNSLVDVRGKDESMSNNDDNENDEEMKKGGHPTLDNTMNNDINGTMIDPFSLKLRIPRRMRVFMESVKVPTATSVSIRPLTFLFDLLYPFEQTQLLELNLKKRHMIQQGTTFTIRHNNITYPFLVEEVKPETVASLVDAHVETTLLPYNPSSSSTPSSSPSASPSSSPSSSPLTIPLSSPRLPTHIVSLPPSHSLPLLLSSSQRIHPLSLTLPKDTDKDYDAKSPTTLSSLPSTSSPGLLPASSPPTSSPSAAFYSLRLPSSLTSIGSTSSSSSSSPPSLLISLATSRPRLTSPPTTSSSASSSTSSPSPDADLYISFTSPFPTQFAYHLANQSQGNKQILIDSSLLHRFATPSAGSFLLPSYLFIGVVSSPAPFNDPTSSSSSSTMSRPLQGRSMQLSSSSSTSTPSSSLSSSPTPSLWYPSVEFTLTITLIPSSFPLPSTIKVLKNDWIKDLPDMRSITNDSNMTKMTDDSNEKTSNSDSSSDPIDGKRCDNCGEVIPLSSFSLHSLQCARQNKKCPTCGDVVPPSMLFKHSILYHSTEGVCLCGLHGHQRELHLHQLATGSDECRANLVECQFCKLRVSIATKSDHQKECGLRVAQCSHCQGHYKRREMRYHISTQHGKPLEMITADEWF